MNIRSHPQIKVDDDFRAICQKIISENRSLEAWDKIESCDMFQQGPYCGGYDAIEQEFSFSYYDANQKEWWIYLSLPIVKQISEVDEYYLDLHEPL